MNLHNHTPFLLEDIEKFEHLAHTISNWRCRDIDLYQHPANSDAVVSVGYTWDKEAIIVCCEPKSGWATALEYGARGEVYVSK